MPNDEKDGVWFVLKSVNKVYHMALVYAVYNEYVSNTINISLQVFDNECGYLNVIEYPPKTGDTSRIAYFPTQNVLDRNTDFFRGWRTAVGVIILKHGVYEEHYDPRNRHYILSVYNVTKRTDYFLTCKRIRQYPRTNKVSVFVGNPDLGPLCSLDRCVDCVCVSSGENISCKSSSEEVQIRIGINTLRLHTRLLENSYEHTINDVNNTSHMQTIECYARFDSNRDIWFRANGSLYIIVPPAELEMSFPMLKYGDLVNITCTAFQVRPPPKLQMTLDGKTADDARQIDVLNDSSQLYTSSLVKQLNLDRRWSNTTAICTSISILNYQEHTQVNSTSKILSYTYPPSHLNMTRPPRIDQVASGYNFHIGCKAFDFTDVCSIKWSSDNYCLNIHSTTVSRQLLDIESWIHVNVSQHTTECRINCRVVCNEYTVLMEENVTVEIPGIAPVTSSNSTESFPLKLIISVSAPLLVLCCTVLAVFIGRKRHLCTQQQSPTEQHHYTSLWNRDGVHFARDQPGKNKIKIK
ncbi:uncharacterized protein LOC127874023 [Dreissena polymorpha]|uniref:uncharacterized protein LOC127874023 n=1 Tax=Dreissena polymorpha TaxID=45954 RepID=UPI0022640440|nr:uncharacterized protein LOC127874023 [Dreissena polymorpha]